MLRIRDINGQVLTLPETARFIEICDSTGQQVAEVIYLNDRGVIQHIRRTDPEAAAYSHWSKMTFCPVIDVNTGTESTKPPVGFQIIPK